jgi:hypothetical protein
MILFTRGSITNPDALASYIEDEMRVVDLVKADGVETAVYRRAAGPGGRSPPRGIQPRRRTRTARHPSIRRLMTLDDEEIYEV